MFDGGERMWPEEAPFHTPVFVVTHTEREPWERPGGTTFHFVNDGIESALARAKEVADGRDIRIGGGADLIQQYLAPGSSTSSGSRSRRSSSAAAPRCSRASGSAACRWNPSRRSPPHAPRTCATR